MLKQFIFITSVSKFNELKPGFNWNNEYDFKRHQPYLSRSLTLSRRSNSLNSALVILSKIGKFPYCRMICLRNIYQKWKLWGNTPEEGGGAILDNVHP